MVGSYSARARVIYGKTSQNEIMKNFFFTSKIKYQGAVLYELKLSVRPLWLLAPCMPYVMYVKS